MNGCDVVVAKRESRLVDGQRCYGMRYRGRAFFFRSEETLREFSNDPSSFSAFAKAQQEEASKSHPQDACPEAGAVKSPPPPSTGGEEDQGQSLHRSSKENSQEIQAQG
jgi:YHS domain-containing protein